MSTNMVQSNTGMGSLIEILNLCAETLTSLNPQQQAAGVRKHRRQGRHGSKRRAEQSAPRLVLLPGGLDGRKNRDSAR